MSPTTPPSLPLVQSAEQAITSASTTFSTDLVALPGYCSSPSPSSSLQRCPRTRSLHTSRSRRLADSANCQRDAPSTTSTSLPLSLSPLPFKMALLVSFSRSSSATQCGCSSRRCASGDLGEPKWELAGRPAAGRGLRLAAAWLSVLLIAPHATRTHCPAADVGSETGLLGHCCREKVTWPS